MLGLRQCGGSQGAFAVERDIWNDKKLTCGSLKLPSDDAEADLLHVKEVLVLLADVAGHMFDRDLLRVSRSILEAEEEAAFSRLAKG